MFLIPAGARLILLSALMLFVELALIRWAGSNVIYLSYFSNFVLLGSFLGIGLGFLRARARTDLFAWAPVALALLAVFIMAFRVEIDRSGSELIFFGSPEPTGLPTWVMLPIIFVVVATAMAFIAEGVARTFILFEPLEAYRLDILGSIFGILAFTGLSFLSAPPVAWGLIVAALFVVLLADRIRLVQGVAILALIGLLLSESLESIDSWSPYYKISVQESADVEDRYGINVNGIPHQVIDPVRTLRGSIYQQPYERAAGLSLDRVLIVGAGTGNDLAIALSRGAGHVDAVEIDPRIYEIGKELHPDDPYADPRVEVIIDDGRAFLERTERTYDLILFALPDSLTVVSGQSSLRLESYLFTEEAIARARSRLQPNGVFAMYNFYREDWLIDRLANTVSSAFGRPPCVDSFGIGARLGMVTVGNDGTSVACDSVWSAPADVVSAATDDRPFLYLRTRSIPPFYLLTIALILAVTFAAVRLVGGPLRRGREYLDLFFMGVAFLLLETKNVVQFSLLFGTTWVVNALVFTGILLSVYLAVEVSRRVRIARPARLYAVLLASLVVAFAVPQHALLNLPAVPRFLAATVLAFTPVFIANLVFAQRFRDVREGATAFALNLLGAMIGGVIEYAALVTGYRALLIVVAVVYGLAFLSGRRALAPAPTVVTG